MSLRRRGRARPKVGQRVHVRVERAWGQGVEPLRPSYSVVTVYDAAGRKVGEIDPVTRERRRV